MGRSRREVKRSRQRSEPVGHYDRDREPELDSLGLYRTFDHALDRGYVEQTSTRGAPLIHSGHCSSCLSVAFWQVGVILKGSTIGRA